RLAGAETAGEETGRRAILLAGLGEVELDRGAGAGQSVSDVGADPRAGVGDRVGDHGPDLLREQVLAVLGEREGRGGKRGQEEAVLLACWTMQLDPAVGLAQALDPALELVAIGGGE